MSQLIQFANTADVNEAVQSSNVRRAIGMALGKHYPGRKWLVDVKIKGGVAEVYLPDISTRYAYSIHIHNKTMDELERKAVMAGGQMLEMFKLSREQGASGGEEDILKLANGEAVHAATGL